jgi:exopolysaccharide production protein ExoQ
MNNTAKRPMRKMPKSIRASATSRSVAASHVIGPAVRRVAGHFYLTPLLILFWFIFYQNVPETLNGFAFKPISTLGAIDRTVKISMIVISLAVISARWSVSRQLLRNINPGLVACMVLIPLSALWSMDSSATLLRFTTLISIVLLCLAIPLAGWDRDRFRQVALPPVMAILILSLAVGILFPDMVKEQGTDISLNNSWHGITYQKNGFGTTASIVTILCVHRLLAPGRHTFWTISGIVIALTCLLLSRSSTSLLSMLLSVVFMTLMLRVPVIKARFSTLVVISIFTLIFIYALAIQNLIPGVSTLLAPVMHLTGKDMTFSARSIIWDVIKERIQAAPWLGTGYGAYWTGPNPGSEAYDRFMALMNFYPSESHNGYLEIMNDLGRVGLICLLAFLVFFVRQALLLMPFDRGQAVLHIALLFQQMVDNLSESEWFSRTATCTLLILGSTCLSRALLEQRLSAQRVVSGGRSS